MLKRNIAYEDFNGNKVVETFYFNLSEAELVEMEVGTEGGFGELLQKIIKTQDGKALISEFKKLILAAYGQKSDDGKRFVKNDTLREEFSQTAAYNMLFVELATNELAAADFIKGVIPASMSSEIAKAETAELVGASAIMPPPLPES